MEELARLKLELLKKKENPNTLLLIRNDETAIRLILTWESCFVALSYDKIELCQSLDEFWDHCQVDFVKWSQKSNIRIWEIRKFFPFLAQNFIIFPDGTVCPQVSAFLGIQSNIERAKLMEQHRKYLPKPEEKEGGESSATNNQTN